jgi:hypothetical protein
MGPVSYNGRVAQSTQSRVEEGCMMHIQCALWMKRVYHDGIWCAQCYNFESIAGSLEPTGLSVPRKQASADRL